MKTIEIKIDDNKLDVFLTIINNLKDDVIKAEFIGVNSSTLNRLKNFLKSKELNFKADMRNSKVYLEIVL